MQIGRTQMADDRELAEAIKNFKSASRQLKLIALNTKARQKPLSPAIFFYLLEIE